MGCKSMNLFLIFPNPHRVKTAHIASTIQYIPANIWLNLTVLVAIDNFSIWLVSGTDLAFKFKLQIFIRVEVEALLQTNKLPKLFPWASTLIDDMLIECI